MAKADLSTSLVFELIMAWRRGVFKTATLVHYEGNSFLFDITELAMELDSLWRARTMF